MNFFDLYQKVFSSGRYNFEACHIPLETKLNIEFFRFMLSEYNDKIVVDFLEFGFPKRFTGKFNKSANKGKNHKGVTEYPLEVRKYLEKEMSYKAVLCLFSEIPFSNECCISPLITVSK